MYARNGIIELWNLRVDLLLFSGASGLADLSRKIGDLRLKADGFYKLHARSGQLHDLRKELDRLKEEKEQIDTQASKYTELSITAKRAKEHYEETTSEYGRVKTRREEIQRLLNARPRLAKLREISKELAPLEDLPDPPPEWAETVGALREEEIRLGTQIQSDTKEVERLTAAIETITIDDVALKLAEKLEDIDPLRARHMTAQKDFPERRQTLRDLERDISACLRQLEREGEKKPERLLLPASTVERMRALMETQSGITMARDNAADELSEADNRLKEMEDKAGSAGLELAGNTEREALLGCLKDTVAAYHASDHTARQQLAERDCRKAQTALDDALAALSPWRGEVGELIGMSVPASALLQEWKTESETIDKQVEKHADEIERLITEQKRLLAEQDAASSVTGLVTDKEHSDIRAERDRAWSDHRNRLDAESADHFETLLRRDDEIVHQRFGHMQELARLHEAAQALKIKQSDLDRAEELHGVARADAEELARKLAKAIGIISPMLPADWPLPQFEVWLSAREKVLEIRATLQDAQGDLKQAQDDALALKEQLVAALCALNPAIPSGAESETLKNLAESTLDAEAERNRSRKTLEDQRRDVDKRKRALERAETAVQQWETDWQKACGSCWLGENGNTPTMADVRGVLKVVAELETALTNRAALAERIGKMEQDQTAFRGEVTTMATELGFACADSDAVMEVVREIETHAQTAKTNRIRKAEEETKLETARAELQKLAAEKQTLDARKQEMTALFAVNTLTEVSAKIGQVTERSRLRQQAKEVTQEILDALNLTNLTEAETALDGADQSALETELAEMTGKAELLEQEWRDSYVVFKEAEWRIEEIGGDARVAKIEEQRRTVLLEIEEGARRYMRLCAGIAATEQALRLYREQHRSSMMARASQALRTISRGRYTSLTTQPDKENEILVAIGSDSSSKLATEMSKGTRFQLYLALRVAGYFEFAKTRSPVPFIADDIMETFDDFRAEEAFRLFAEMAETGQVIYLTHHRHLCEIVRQVCPTAKIHNLPEEVAHERQLKGPVDGVELGGKQHGTFMEMDLNRTQ